MSIASPMAMASKRWSTTCGRSGTWCVSELERRDGTGSVEVKRERYGESRLAKGERVYLGPRNPQVFLEAWGPVALAQRRQVGGVVAVAFTCPDAAPSPWLPLSRRAAVGLDLGVVVTLRPFDGVETTFLVAGVVARNPQQQVGAAGLLDLALLQGVVDGLHGSVPVA